MQRLISLVIPFLFLFHSLFAQQTVGLFLNDSVALNGYTLFSANTSTYLVDNCGFVVNTWQSEYHPGLGLYLLDNGNLLRTARIAGSFSGGGIGGRLELYSWEGDLLWSYDYANEFVHQHHDIEPLPNGNVLILAWERKNEAETIQAGRNPSSISNQGLWPEHLVEIEMVGANDINIVWEWHLWDHLIQDLDATVDNFGIIKDHPELININHGVSGGAQGGDWVHANAVSYNPTRDEIALSSRIFNEIWIIDHSTTTEEAAGHTGGTSGKGGDILYRWGNPEVYDRGSAADQRLYGQHDIRWIPDNYPNGGKLIVFNNGTGRPDGNYSSVDIWSPPLDANGNYLLEAGQSFGPSNVEWTFVKEDFYSQNISGAYPLSNGNILVCEGRDGHFREVTMEKEIVWEYINPTNGNGIITEQGEEPHQNDVFRATRYATDYAAFDGKDLTPIDLIELNPLPSNCMIFENPISSTAELATLEGIHLRNNLVESTLFIDNVAQTEVVIEIYNLAGQKLYSKASTAQLITLDAISWQKGIFLVRIFNESRQQFIVQRIVKI